MAFLSNTSRLLIHRQLKQIKCRAGVLRYLSYLQNDQSRNNCQHQYTAVPYIKQILFTHSGEKRGTNRITFGSVSSRHFLSTGSQQTQNNIEVLSKISSSEQSTNKVLFIEKSESLSSSSSLAPSQTENLPHDSYTSFFNDAESSYAEAYGLMPTEIIEPTLGSLGLCNYTPVGLIQWCLEVMHINAGLPWWLSIVVATSIARVLLFPIFIKAQKNASHMANVMPRVQHLQQQFNQARRTGNAFETSRLANEMMSFMKENNVNPLKNAMIPMLQAPVFISFFLGLRSMAKLPVDSMKTGGFSWITDLTVPDPYYIMPFLSCSTLYVVLKLGAESGVRMENMNMTRYIFTALPFIAFPFCMHFQSAVLFYWCTNNFITLGLVGLMKIPGVREFFKIPRIVPPDPEIVSKKKKGFIKGLKEAYSDQKIIKTLEERKRIDSVRFQKAGTGPIPRTYAYDPTKPRPATAAAKAQQKQTKTQ